MVRVGRYDACAFNLGLDGPLRQLCRQDRAVEIAASALLEVAAPRIGGGHINKQEWIIAEGGLREEGSKLLRCVAA